MIVLPETLTETQNKFLLYYALQGLDFALEKADVKLSTLRGWLKKDSFKNLMEEIQTQNKTLWESQVLGDYWRPEGSLAPRCQREASASSRGKEGILLHNFVHRAFSSQ